MDYLREAEKQLSNKNVYQEIQYYKQVLSSLVDISNKFVRGLKMKGFIVEKVLKYFTYEYKKVCNTGKMYLLPKIHEILLDAHERPVISNCGMNTEKVFKFLDYLITSYIRDSGHFLKRNKNINNPLENKMLVTAYVVGLYPSIPHQACLSVLIEALEKKWIVLIIKFSNVF